MSEQCVIGAVEAVNKAKRRIAREDYRPGVTFFSAHDTWLYQAVYAPTPKGNPTCPLCRNYEMMSDNMGGFQGNFIRALFPYLTILDENTIGGPDPSGDGLVHPNCRCKLVRKLD